MVVVAPRLVEPEMGCESVGGFTWGVCVCVCVCPALVTVSYLRLDTSWPFPTPGKICLDPTVTTPPSPCSCKSSEACRRLGGEDPSEAGKARRSLAPDLRQSIYLT